jgi:hypothetical protein
LPACSHKRCARSLISCSVGSDNCISCCEARPTLGIWGAWRRAVQASDQRQLWPADSSLDRAREFLVARAIRRVLCPTSFSRTPGI